jgi:hypothetical protein
MTITATCSFDREDWHVHEYTVPLSPGYHLEIEERVHEERPGVDRVTAWRVREPVLPWLPSANYALVGDFREIGAAFAALTRGQCAPAVACTAAKIGA